MVDKMTEEQIVKLTTLFSEADKDEDGFINAKELGEVFEKLGETKTKEELDELAKIFSESGDFTKITLEELIALRAQETGMIDPD